jgi:hypothetical protein
MLCFFFASALQYKYSCTSAPHQEDTGEWREVLLEALLTSTLLDMNDQFYKSSFFYRRLGGTQILHACTRRHKKICCW